MRRHVVLIGLPGAGKTTVGRIAGAALEATFSDVDEEIARRTGLSVAEIFAERGEQAFRDLERTVTAELLGREPGVIAPGGGWAVQPGALEGAVGHALVVHLKVTAGVALRRLGAADDRPLIAGEPEQRLRELEVVRSVFYARAEAEVETVGLTPDDVARGVVTLARSHAGW